MYPWFLYWRCQLSGNTDDSGQTHTNVCTFLNAIKIILDYQFFTILVHPTNCLIKLHIFEKLKEIPETKGNHLQKHYIKLNYGQFYPNYWTALERIITLKVKIKIFAMTSWNFGSNFGMNLENSTSKRNMWQINLVFALT